jgi:Asp-tRNA(Asn)/Glu-tRNA(Gln) amidotransferase A subunit family amidase
VSIGLGTDTAGSIRIPASYLGLFGLRTTHGLVDTRGMLALAPSFDTVGWLTTDALTLAAITDVLLPSAPRTPITRGLLLPTVTACADEPVRAAFTDAVDRLADRAILSEVDTVDLDPAVLAEWSAAFRTIQARQAWQQHGQWITAHPHALGPDVAARFAIAATTSDDEAARASTRVEQARAQLRSLLPPDTALLLPSASSVAPSRDTEPGSPALEATRSATLRMTCLAGLAGAPAISMPLAQVAGLPVGISALAAPGADRDLTELAERAHLSARR